MVSFSTVWPALGATGAFLCFLLGYRMMRGKVSEYLDAADLILLKEERRREAAGRLSLLERVAGRLVPSLRRAIGAPGVGYLQRQIDYAGRPTGVTVDGLLRKVCWWVILMSPALVIFLVRGQILGAVLVPIVAVLLPLMRVAGQSRRRRESIDRDLPDFLDILAVTVSAGISFRSALSRVIERFQGPISSEVRLTLDQLSHGASMRAAFSNMERRSGSQAIHRFVSAFLQAEELGAPLTEALNQIALDMRRENSQNLRRKAAQTSPRVTLITSLILVPATLILIVVGIVLGADIDLGALTGSFS